MKKLLFTSIGLILFILTTQPVTAVTNSNDCLLSDVKRTFMQIFLKDAQQSAKVIEQQFAALEEAGFEEVILQWSSYDYLSLYSFLQPDGRAEIVLPKIINAAQKHNIRLWLGTHYNNNFWDAVEYPEQKAREWLDHQLTMLKKRLPALISTVRHADPDHKTVIGWYISEEIDDQNWMLAGKEQALTDYLYKTVKLLRSEEPEWPIMISGFSNGYTPPIELAFFWKQILASTGIDTLLFQDGVGADKL